MGNAKPDPPGQALARLRVAAGLSARQLAEKAGVSHNAVVRAECGRSTTRDVVAKLEAVLGPKVRAMVVVWPPVATGASIVARARRQSGESTRQVAERAGVSRGVLKRAEDGLGVHPANAKKIADAFGLDVADVLFPVEEDPADPLAA